MSVHKRNARVTVRSVQGFKDRGERIPMLTCYDYSTARVMQEAGVPALLVGDSAANVIHHHLVSITLSLSQVLVARAMSQLARPA